MKSTLVFLPVTALFLPVTALKQAPLSILDVYGCLSGVLCRRTMACNDDQHSLPISWVMCRIDVCGWVLCRPACAVCIRPTRAWLRAPVLAASMHGHLGVSLRHVVRISRGSLGAGSGRRAVVRQQAVAALACGTEPFIVFDRSAPAQFAHVERGVPPLGAARVLFWLPQFTCLGLGQVRYTPAGFLSLPLLFLQHSTVGPTGVSWRFSSTVLSALG